jgi:hypothetical protein
VLEKLDRSYVDKIILVLDEPTSGMEEVLEIREYNMLFMNSSENPQVYYDAC